VAVDQAVGVPCSLHRSLLTPNKEPTPSGERGGYRGRGRGGRGGGRGGARGEGDRRSRTGIG
jgi:hypothetical protein